MINITLVKINHNIVTIEASGHSGYAEAGSDIVCSAVSTLCQNLIMSLQKVLGINPKFIIDEKIPFLSVSLPLDMDKESMKNSQILMKSVCLGLKDIRDSYSKYIKIKEIQHD